MNSLSRRSAFLTSVPVILVAGCAVALLNTGPRSTMGFFLTPMTRDNGWGREIFALAIAIQNLAWGAAQPFVGMIADRLGTGRVLVGGSLLYAAGLLLMTVSSDPVSFQFSAGLVVGLGIAGSSFTMALAAFARLLPEHMRTLAFGLGTAAGSAGQFIFAPLGQAFIQAHGWKTALFLLAASCLLVPVFAWFIRGKPKARPVQAGQADQSIVQALREAFGHRSYQLLVAGFFVCGFQIAFTTVHLPAYLNDIGIPAVYGGWSIALIGGFNIVGSISAGLLSGRMPKRWLLAFIYLARALAIAVYVVLPPSVPSTLVFSAVMGLLWLSTVPPTQQLVAVMFGTRYLATLFGFVFFSHQVGSFLGVWLGGLLYDRYGTYIVVWWLAVALGVFAAIVHAPIVERQVPRPAAA
ncbi:MAG TPA: MFS transporter [Bauldia sp.]|nr:MFS transporter [Bauldia sp.]